MILILISLIKKRSNIIKTIKENIILVFLTSVICFYMKAGYDGSLYHLPHQNFLKDYKIIFGLFNLHERFGIISIYGYISSILWIKNDLILLSFLQGIFYFLIFKILKILLQSNHFAKQLFSISTIIFIPIWIRYIEPSYSLVDLPTGIFFYFAFYKGIELIILKENINENYKEFLLISSLLFTLKSSSAVFIIYVLFISFYLLKKKYFKINNIIFLYHYQFC